MLQKLLETIHWLNAEPGRKRGLTLALGIVGQLLHGVGTYHVGGAVTVSGAMLEQGVNWLVLFASTDMAPLVDILTIGMAFVAFWHPVSKAAAEAVGVPPPTEVPTTRVPESFQTIPAIPPPNILREARITQGPGFRAPGSGARG